MSGAYEHSQTLEQLQHEVNLVLEHTGRLFAASSKNDPNAALPYSSRLKQALPGAINRFHEALDVLEDELQMAKAVMRRDLALCREKAGVKSGDSGLIHPQIHRSEKQTGTGEVEPSKSAVLKASDIDLHDGAQPNPDPVEEVLDEPSHANRFLTPPAEGEQQPHLSDTDQKPNEGEAEDAAPRLASSALHIDTQPQSTAVDGNQDQQEEVPNTGTYSNNNIDLDSLFGDPNSAGGLGASTSNPGSVSAPEFDFGSFNAGLEDHNSGDDNISKLLPGIGDYATTQPSGSGDVDFSMLADITADAGQTMNTDGELQAAEDNMGDDGQGDQQRDSTFDDLMDFAEFNAGDYDEGGDGNDGSDFSFFPK